MYVRELTCPIIEATVSVTPEGVSILRRARVAGNQGIPLRVRLSARCKLPKIAQPKWLALSSDYGNISSHLPTWLSGRAAVS